MSMVLTAFMTFYFRHENARRDKLLLQMGVNLDDYREQMKIVDREKGDDAIFFRYTV